MSNDSTYWRRTGSVDELKADELHVWRAHIPSVRCSLEKLAALLTSAEHLRATRYYREEDRVRFTVARGLLRYLLGEYLEVKGNGIVLRYGEQGKPDIAAPLDSGLCFNLSHSRDWIAYCFARRYAVGIDVEYIRSDTDYEAIQYVAFSEVERTAFSQIPPKARKKVFFDWWTRKEAYLKAVGTGFSIPATEIELHHDSSDLPLLLKAPGEQNPARWSIYPVDLADGYAGSIAAETSLFHFGYFEWTVETSNFSGCRYST